MIVGIIADWMRQLGPVTRAGRTVSCEIWSNRQTKRYYHFLSMSALFITVYVGRDNLEITLQYNGEWLGIPGGLRRVGRKGKKQRVLVPKGALVVPLGNPDMLEQLDAFALQSLELLACGDTPERALQVLSRLAWCKPPEPQDFERPGRRAGQPL